MNEIDREELALDGLFASLPPVAPPVGFRDGVMRRIRGRSTPVLEWAFAGILVIPSLLFLLWELFTGGLGIDSAVANLVSAGTSATDTAFFFVDGMVVLAFGLLGLGALIGSDALMRTSDRRR